MEPESEDGGAPSPGIPRHAYWMKRTEVTQGEWGEVMGSNPSAFPSCGPTCPVDSVSFFDAVAYCNAISKREGLPSCYTDGPSDYDAASAKARNTPLWRDGPRCLGYRLPTEEEWEHAARLGEVSVPTSDVADPKALRRVCDRDASLDRMAWYCGGVRGRAEGSHPVKQKAPNSLGLYDMLGNVGEWTWGWSWTSYGNGHESVWGYASESRGGSWGSLLGWGRVARGGSWRTETLSFPHARSTTLAANEVGLRPVRSMPQGALPSAPAPAIGSQVAASPAPDLGAARRSARALFARALAEPDHAKARALFLEAASVLPPGGPALYEAARLAASDGDTATSRPLFERARRALEQSTHLQAALGVDRGFSNDRGGRQNQPATMDFSAGAGGRLLLVHQPQGTVVYDTLAAASPTRIPAPAPGDAGATPRVARLDLEARFQHEGWTPTAALSSDGAVVAYVTNDRLFSCSLAEGTCARAELAVPILDLAMSLDGEAIAAVDGEGAVEIRDAATLAPRTTIAPREGRVSAVAFTRAGDRVILGLAEGQLLRARVDTGEVESTLLERGGGDARAITELAVDGAEGRFAAARGEVVRVWAPGQAKPRVQYVHNPVDSMAFSPDGTTLFVGTTGCQAVPCAQRSRQLHVWPVADKAMTSIDLSDNDRDVYRFAPTPQRLYQLKYSVFGGFDSCSQTEVLAREIGLVAPRPSLRAEVSESFKRGVAIKAGWGACTKWPLTLDGAADTLAADSSWDSMSLWDLGRGVLLPTPHWDRGAYLGAKRFSPDGKTLLADQTTGGGDHGPMVHVLLTIDVATGRTTSKEELGQNDVGDQAVRSRLPPRLPPGVPESAGSGVEAKGTLAWMEGVYDTPVLRVGPRSGPFRAFQSLGRTTTPMSASGPSYALSPSGALVAFQAAEDRVEIWQVGPAARAPLHVVRRAGITGVVFAAEDTAFISALDGTITTVRGGVERTLSTPDGSAVWHLRALRDGSLVAAATWGSDADIVHVYSADGTLRATLASYAEGKAMVTSPGGRAEVFGSADRGFDCRFGPFVFGLDLCRERLVPEGLLARLLRGDRVDP